MRWLIGLSLITLLLRLPFFGSPAVHIDEQFYLVVADKWVHHGLIPFVDIWDRKPIGTFLLYAIPELLTPDPILGYQILATIFVIATGAVIIALGRMIADVRTGFVAAVIYAIAVGLMEGPGGQTPVFYSLPVALAVLIYLKAARRGGGLSLAQAMAIGCGSCLLFGLAIQIKYVAAIEGAALSLFFLTALRLRHIMAWSQLVPLALAMVVCGLLPSAIVAVSYAAIGHWSELYETNVASIFAKHLWNLPFKEFLRRFWESSLFCIFFLPFAAYSLSAWRRLGLDAGQRWVFAGIVLWVVMALPGALMLGNPTRHYFLPTLAPMALLAAIGLAQADRLPGFLGAFFADLRRLWSYAPLAAILIVPVIGTAIIAVENPRERGEAEDVYALARDIKSRVTPGQCIFVFDRLPILYSLTDTCAPSIYLFPNHVSEIGEVRTPGGERLKELARILASKPPVIYTRRPYTPDIDPEAIGMLERTLSDSYDLKYVRRGAYQFHTVYVPKVTPAGGP